MPARTGNRGNSRFAPQAEFKIEERYTNTINHMSGGYKLHNKNALCTQGYGDI